MRGLGETSVVYCGVLEGGWEGWFRSKNSCCFNFFIVARCPHFFSFFFYYFFLHTFYYNIQGVGVVYVRHYLNRAEKLCREEDGNDWYEVEAVQNAIG